MNRTGVALGVLLMVGVFAIGSFTDVRGYEWWMLQSTTAGGAVGTTSVTVPATPYSLARTGLQSVWEISATYQSKEPVASSSTVTYQFVVDGASVSGCSWSITREPSEIVALGIIPVLTSALSSDHHFFVRCLNATVVNPGTHTVAITATGTNPVTNSRTDIMLRQTDSVLDNTLDFLGPTLTYTNSLINRTQNYQNAQGNASAGASAARDFYANLRLNQSQAYQNAQLNLTYANLRSFIHVKTGYTNFLINTSFANQRSWFNDTFAGLNFTGANITFNPEPDGAILGMSAFPGMGDDQTSALIVMGVLMIWCLWYGFYWPAFGAFLAVLSQLVFGADWFIWALLFILIGFGVEMFGTNRRKNQEDKHEASQEGYG